MDIRPATNTVHDHKDKPTVLIVGAGIGGLSLGILLQKADILYEIFERTAEIKPLGSAISLNSTTAPFLRQIGVYDEFHAVSKRMEAIQIANENREIEFAMADADLDQVERYGADARIVSRPILYSILLKQVPKERIHLSKKVLSTQQGDKGVTITCSDGTQYKGDILVGADRAYSAVRQNLYAQLKEKDLLPPSDGLPLPFSTVCLVGQTHPLDESQFPDIVKQDTQFMNILSRDKPYYVMTFTTQQNCVCYAVIQYLTKETSKEDDTFRQSEWGAEAAGTMCEEVRDFRIISGGKKLLTLGDLIDWTPKELISKVMLEEKVFTTWSHDRTVLIGDACHKINPAGGAGAANAIHDAIVLANYIHAFRNNPTDQDIAKAFKAYKDERIEWVNSAFETSQALKSMVDKGWKPRLIRLLVKYMPKFVNRAMEARLCSNRPQVYFLPLDTTPATLTPAPQPSLNARDLFSREDDSRTTTRQRKKAPASV
ncbi:hypothetical protein BG015_006294 [Linnemannia schmuckeri]|uniref:FAD-binding domain-containing protein n=1 Tax=Linnemannia schmuckeri TaxID=64567 RepID=A0A9P5S2L8_9FUNG|nr:hypothetical protein BG015_006294 [Linnemannia schmuckeri]